MRWKSMKASFFCPLAAGLLMTAGSLFAQSPIEGKVSDVKGHRLSGVTVTLEGRFTGRRLMVTDEKGGYRFEGIGTGVYQLTFQRSGFMAVSRQVMLTYDDDSGDLNVTLTADDPKKKTAAQK